MAPEHYALKPGCESLGRGLVGGAERVASCPNGGILVMHQAYLRISGTALHSLAWDDSDAASEKGVIDVAERLTMM
jgi:hypothetical protein